jgi:hypothetical protein
MNLAKDFAAAGTKVLRCATCKTLAELPASDRDALQAAIDNRELSVRIIVDVCTTNGVTVNKHSVDEHRHGRCPRP